MRTNEKSREPFDPERTPEPPQVSNPLGRRREQKAGQTDPGKKDLTPKNKNKRTNRPRKSS